MVVVAVAINKSSKSHLTSPYVSKLFLNVASKLPNRAAQVTAVISTLQRVQNTFIKQSCQAQDIGKFKHFDLCHWW